MHVADNSKTIVEDIFNDSKIGKMGNQTISDLVTAYPHLLVFPANFGVYEDNIESNFIFKMSGSEMSTFNIMGFIGSENSNLTIGSRFQKNQSSRDYFMQYLLQKVFNLNMFDLKINTSNEDIWEVFLIFLFPYYLSKALNQGIYKSYISRQFNNANFKGRVDVNRHIKLNNPFLGNIAYQARTHESDNQVTQLIRHTIEFIFSKSHFGSVLTRQSNFWSNVTLIKQITPNYQKNKLRNVIAENSLPIRHPLYGNYELLRKICLNILRRKGLSISNRKDEVYGLLFDGAWLWEEYLNTLLRPLDFIHPQNKTKLNPIYLYTNRKSPRYPDFYNDKLGLVLDAKYKYNGNLQDEYQLISYLHILKSRKGCFILPSPTESNSDCNKLNGYGGEILSYSLKIPQDLESYSVFSQEMKLSEDKFIAFCKAL